MGDFIDGSQKKCGKSARPMLQIRMSRVTWKYMILDMIRPFVSIFGRSMHHIDQIFSKFDFDIVTNFAFRFLFVWAIDDQQPSPMLDGESLNQCSIIQVNPFKIYPLDKTFHRISLLWLLLFLYSLSVRPLNKPIHISMGILDFHFWVLDMFSVTDR